MEQENDSDELIGCLIHLTIIGILLLFAFPIIGMIVTVIRLLLGYENIGFIPDF